MTAPAPLTGSEWLARTITDSGITHVFFMDASLRRTLIELGTTGVKRVLAHTEKAAAYMADGYARVRKGPGICAAQSVGAANLAAGLQDAYLHRSPVIAITGRKPPSQLYRNGYQEIKHEPMFEAVTKFTAPVEDSRDLPRLFRHAWRTAVTGTPRPVHLDLNGHLTEFVERGEAENSPGIEPALFHVPPHRPTPPAADIDRAVKALTGAPKVLIVAGAGAVLSDAGPELLRVAEALSAPIATSLGGRGIVPTRHRLSIGTIGGYGGTAHGNAIALEADLVLFVGCHTGDQVTHTWRVPRQGTPIVQIDIDPIELGRNYPTEVALMGDPKLTVAAIADRLGKPKRDGGYAESAASKLSAWRQSLAQFETNEETPIRIERLCAELTKLLPEDAILVADTGFSGIWTATMVELNGTKQTYLRAAGSLGWALPAALGAKCAAPDRPVVCFTGDGGIYYHLTELETARRCGLPIVVVINNNSGFAQSWANVHPMQGNRPGNPRELALFGPLDFAEIAKSFGVKAIRVEAPSRIAPALSEALASNEIVVIDIVTHVDNRAHDPGQPPA